MKKVFAVIGVVLISIVGFGLLAFSYMFFTKDIPVTEDEEKLILNAFDLQYLYEDYEPSQQYEVLKKIRYLDGTTELSYEYDSPLADEPYILVQVDTESTVRDAKLLFDSSYGQAR